MNENFIVEYSSNGEEAKLFDGANNTYELKSALSVMEEKYYKNNNLSKERKPRDKNKLLAGQI